MKTEELTGADLDLAVAMAGGEWKTAHELWPTMTLDPTFKGAFIATLENVRRCMLRPNNPFRQDPQHFCPSTDWAIGGRIIERERITIRYEHDEGWGATFFHQDGRTEDYLGPTPLIAAMRAFVASRTTGEQDTGRESNG